MTVIRKTANFGRLSMTRFQLHEVGSLGAAHGTAAWEWLLEIIIHLSCRDKAGLDFVELRLVN